MSAVSFNCAKHRRFKLSQNIKLCLIKKGVSVGSTLEKSSTASGGVEFGFGRSVGVVVADPPDNSKQFGRA
jgi:hypothetical protein